MEHIHVKKTSTREGVDLVGGIGFHFPKSLHRYLAL